MKTYLLYLCGAFLIAVSGTWAYCLIRVKCTKAGIRSELIQMLITLIWIFGCLLPAVLLIIRADHKLKEQGWSQFSGFLCVTLGTLAVVITMLTIFYRFFDRHGKPRGKQKTTRVRHV